MFYPLMHESHGCWKPGTLITTLLFLIIRFSHVAHWVQIEAISISGCKTLHNIFMNAFHTLGCNNANTTVVLVHDHWGSVFKTTNSGNKQSCGKVLTMCVNTKSPTYSVLCFQGFRVKWEDHIWFWCCHKVSPNGVDVDASIVCKVSHIENWHHPITKIKIQWLVNACDLLYMYIQ